MGRHHSLRKVLLAAVLLAACGDDGSYEAGGSSDDELTSDPGSVTGTPTRDAAMPLRDDAGRDVPAAAAGDAGDESTDEEDLLDGGMVAPTAPMAEPDASTLDAGTPRVDAGFVRRDAAVAPVDASAPVDAGSTNPADYSCADFSYESFGRAFMKKYCNNCHSAQKPTLLTLETVALNKAVVMQTTVTTTRMPLKSGNVPTAAERVRLGVWLDCGPY